MSPSRKGRCSRGGGGSKREKYALLATLVFALLVTVRYHRILLDGLSIGELNNQYPISVVQSSSPPPEDLETIEFCAEKCRYVRAMCNGLHRDRLALPAPSCLNYSLTVKGDIYWQDFLENGTGTEAATGRGINFQRNQKTVELVDWAAGLATERRRQKMPSTGNATSTRRCESVPTENTNPMMWPEEFEFITKLMSNLKPTTYLEWGCGTSTSFYPLLSSGQVIAIDGYPPWCEKVASEPRVKCMVDEGRLKFYCPEIVGADGVTKLALQNVGKLPAGTPNEDIEAAMRIYVDTSFTRAVAETKIKMLDVALVDGRFRLQCALRLLPHLGPDSILLLHDFWVRLKAYKIVLEYYYVVGYARSVVALKKKEGMFDSEDMEKTIYEKYMKREYLFWYDIPEKRPNGVVKDRSIANADVGKNSST